MATSNNALRVADLDFFSIKENIKNYLRSQSQFTDFDYEGSGMSVLLDILAYNTYYNSFYLNMAANEAFLDTAQIRQNILSHAKSINYVPASSQGAYSKISVKVTPTTTEDANVNILTLDKYTRFLGKSVEGINYPFVALYSNTAYKANGSFLFPNVQIKQGEVVTLQFPAFANNISRRYQIPSANVDVSTISITVQQSKSNTYTEVYSRSTDITEVTNNSQVYFVEEDDSLHYTVYFGDGVIGKRPVDGNIINVTYLDTAGSISNNISQFINTDPIGGKFSSNVKISSYSPSYGGVDKEDINSIRFRAPYYYTAQNRAVTTTDYETLILKDYDNIDAISVWGGEDHVPVTYGKVFLSIKTKGYYALTLLEKEKIKNDLIKNRNVLTVIPEIIDPDYTYIQVRGQVKYNPSKTTKTSDELLTIVKNAISQYNNDQLNGFKSVFKKSTLQKYIEESDGSITTSDVNILLQKRVNIDLNKNKNYVIDFYTPLEKGNFKYKFNTYPQLRILDTSQFYSDELFVTTLYETLLGREPEPEGLKYWVKQLTDGASRSYVTNAFVNSLEFKDNASFVRNLYKRLLNREADSAGLEFWVGQLNKGVSRSNIITQFINSPEFNSLINAPLLSYIPGNSLVTRDIIFEESPYSMTGVDSIEIVNKGMNYSSTPAISIVGDGTGAVAEATIIGGRVEEIRITNPGKNYTRADVYIVGGDGKYAIATAKLQSKKARIRSFYYKESTGEKVEFNPNAGYIDYDTGRVMITSNPLTVNKVLENPFYDNNILSVNAISESDAIYPLRNRILTIDMNNGLSVQLYMIAES